MFKNLGMFHTAFKETYLNILGFMNTWKTNNNKQYEIANRNSAQTTEPLEENGHNTFRLIYVLPIYQYGHLHYRVDSMNTNLGKPQ